MTDEMKDFIAPPFLSVGSFRVGDEIKIASTPKIEMNKWNKKRMSLFVQHNGENKVLALTPTQARQIVAIFGEQFASWIGKSLTAEKEQVTLKDGRAVETLKLIALEKVGQ